MFHRIRVMQIDRGDENGRNTLLTNICWRINRLFGFYKFASIK